LTARHSGRVSISQPAEFENGCIIKEGQYN
jgi:hypothetical protein